MRMISLSSLRVFYQTTLSKSTHDCLAGEDEMVAVDDGVEGGVVDDGLLQQARA